jgi:hypothetical protein
MNATTQKIGGRPSLVVATTALFAGVMSGQQNSGLQYLQTIGIPGWKATGAAGNANVDLTGYNPVTRMMYLADRTNNGIDVIDTHANVVVGLVKMPASSPPQNTGHRSQRGAGSD